MNSGRPLVQLTLVRIRDFLREPEAVFWAVCFPILLTVGFGFAFRDRPDPILKIAATPDVAARLRAQPGLDVREMPDADARVALRNGDVALVASQDGTGGVVFSFDPTNAEARTARALADGAIQRAAGRTDPVKVSDQITHEPGARYVDFLVPGLVGVGIMSDAVWGLGFSIVDSRRRKLIKRLIATPMSRVEYLSSYLVWRLILLPVEVVIPLSFGHFAFGVPIRGSWLAIAFVCLLGSTCFSALGILIGSRARTIEAVSGIMNLVIMPQWIVSGVFFSAQRFPDFAQPLIKLLPLTALIDAMRAVQLRGVGLAGVSPQLGILAAWCVIAFVAGLRMFRWR